jgi:hypothetical protein
VLGIADMVAQDNELRQVKKGIRMNTQADWPVSRCGQVMRQLHDLYIGVVSNPFLAVDRLVAGELLESRSLDGAVDRWMGLWVS